MTNADKIRAITTLSNEELVQMLNNPEVLAYFLKKFACPASARCNGQSCTKCWLDWLKEEAKDAAD